MLQDHNFYRFSGFLNSAYRLVRSASLVLLCAIARFCGVYARVRCHSAVQALTGWQEVSTMAPLVLFGMSNMVAHLQLQTECLGLMSF